MILTLNKFKCWDNLTIEIPLNKVTLIKGRSGKGKTTILSAIDWVLYGAYKKVGPKHAPTSKTSVTLSINNIQMTRTKNPNKFTLIENGIKYEDVNAQHKVNDLYGIYEVWLATSYMQQLSNNYFLISPNQTKIDLLNKISFQDQDPNEYIVKIDKELDKVKTLHQYQLTEYNKKYVDYQYDELNILKDYDIIKDKFNHLKTQELDLQQLKTKYDNQQLLIHNKEDQLSSLQKQLSCLIKPVFNESIDVDTDNLQQTNEYIKKLKGIEKNLDQFYKLEKQLSTVDLPDYNYTLDDLQKTLLNEKLYHDNAKLCQYLNIDHDEETVKEYIEHLNDVLSAQPQLEKEEELKNLYKQQTDIMNKINNIILKEPVLAEENDVGVLEKQLSYKQHYISHLLDTKESIKCPHCELDVLYKKDISKKGILVKINVSNVESVEQEIKCVEETVKNLNIDIDKKKKLNLQNQKLYEQQKSLYDKNILLKQNLTLELECITNQIHMIEKLKMPKSEHVLLKPQEKNQIYKVLGELKNIKIVPPTTISSTVIKEYLDKKQMYDQQLLIKSQYDNLLLLIPKQYIRQDLKIPKLDSYVKSTEEYLYKHQHLLSSCEELQEQLNQIIRIDNPTIQLNNVTESITLLHNKLVLHDEHSMYKQKQLELMNEKKELEKLIVKIDQLSHLKKIAVNVECDILKNIVNTINYNMKDLSDTMFEDNIKIDMNLYKKVGDKIKQDINFSIIYKGGKYDSVLELSVGEVNRASIALTLALNKLSSSPIIIFDEALKSLDPELKLEMIEIIKQNIHSTVILAEHGYIESAVDHIIDVELLK